MSIAVAFGAMAGAALAGAASAPAHAQVVVGNAPPDVVVNLEVLDRLGPPPALPTLLQDRRGGSGWASAPALSAPAYAPTPYAPSAAPGEVEFKPYRPDAPVKTVSQPRPPKAAKAEASPAASPAVAELVQAARDIGAAAPGSPAGKDAPKAKSAPPSPGVAETIAAPPRAEPARMTKVEPVSPPAAPAVSTPAAPAVPASSPPPAATALTPPAPPAQATQVASPVPSVPPSAPVAAEPAPQQASVSGAAIRQNGDDLSLMFAADSATLPAGARPEIEKIARKMEKDEALGLQLLAYAEGSAADASKARRLSLSRALEVRKILMEAGIRSTRIEVRALGNKGEGAPSDRVDAHLVTR